MSSPDLLGALGKAVDAARVDRAEQLHRPHPTLLAVRTAMQNANTPVGPDDPPYPASLTPIARAVLNAVADEVANVWGEFADEDLEDAATRIAAWLREVAAP